MERVIISICNECAGTIQGQVRNSKYSVIGMFSRKQLLHSSHNIVNHQEKEESVSLDHNLINHLERTSLVDFGNEEAITRLEEAISFANTIFEVDTIGVEPMISVLDNTSLRLREDKSTESDRKKIIMNASKIVEDYFVSPPGNIPLTPSTKFIKPTKENNANRSEISNPM